jgi:hypothetical protein
MATLNGEFKDEAVLVPSEPVFAEEARHEVVRTTMMCGGWGGARPGDDLPAMQGKLDAVRGDCERMARSSAAGAHDSADSVDSAFQVWELASYTESSQVVAGTNYAWVCKVKIGARADGGGDRFAECTMKQFVALRPPIEAPRLTGFRFLYGDARDAAAPVESLHMVATPIHHAVAEQMRMEEVPVREPVVEK